MIYGLINYFCITGIRGNSNFTEYYCKDEEKENKGYINYFIHSYISIIIAILLMPFLFFLRMFFSNKYMETTNNNALIFNCKIYFFEFFIFLIAFLISQNLDEYGYQYPINYDAVFWIINGLASGLYELLIFIILKATNLFFIFNILVFRSLIFHVYKSWNTGNYLYYLIVPLITNVIGVFTFSYFSDDNLLNAFKSSLNEENGNEINSDLLYNNNNNKTTDDGNMTDFNDNNFTNNGNDYITPNGDNYNETKYFSNNANMDEVQIVKNENIRLKNENDRLKLQNNYQNTKIQTLESKIQNLEHIIENLSQKVALLENK